jgi:hypothetical protein
MADLAKIYGVRHFSPAAALHLERFLDETDPQVVLVEAPSDASSQLAHMAHDDLILPIAILAFTRTRPVRSMVYPLASYSPEWVAFRWAQRRGRRLELIDLPAAVFLELHQPDDERDHTLDDPCSRIAQLTGNPDHDTWWERQFEHTVALAAYRDAIREFGRSLREVRTASPEREQETLLREAYMRRQIRAAAPDPEQAVVVCGAYHAPVLDSELPVMTDAEVAALPVADTMLTLMPYSYPRLSSQSGYGAGNHAPAYFQALYDAVRAGHAGEVPSRYAASLARHLREQGLNRSAAEVIEVVRLAEGLAVLAGSSAPALADLRDAAITVLGQGERTPLVAAMRAVEIGSAIGQLPAGIPRTALQEDFHQVLKNLKLTKFLEDRLQPLELDLRENRFVKDQDAAFLDRRRSTFLHRLQVLDVPFALPEAREQAGTAKEAWKLRWVPECEIRLAERSLEADAVEQAAALLLTRRIDEADDVGTATEALVLAYRCELASAASVALRRVQGLAVDEAGFVAAAAAVSKLADLVRYGDVRQIDPAPLVPVLSQLYLRATLLLPGASGCDDEAAIALREGMEAIHTIAFLQLPEIEPERWVAALGTLAVRDSGNPLLAGFAAALLIERGRMDDATIDREVSRRLSPGMDASIGVGYFEGLVQRNRTALFLRKALWSSLERYVDQLDDEAFRRALLYLRRAFATFSVSETRRVVSLLGEIWKGVGTAPLAAAIERSLDDEELKELEGLDLV